MKKLLQLINEPTPASVTALVAACTVVLQGLQDQLSDAPLDPSTLYWLMKLFRISNVLIAGLAVFITQKKAAKADGI